MPGLEYAYDDYDDLEQEQALLNEVVQPLKYGGGAAGTPERKTTPEPAPASPPAPAAPATDAPATGAPVIEDAGAPTDPPGSAPKPDAADGGAADERAASRASQARCVMEPLKLAFDQHGPWCWNWQVPSLHICPGGSGFCPAMPVDAAGPTLIAHP